MNHEHNNYNRKIVPNTKISIALMSCETAGNFHKRYRELDDEKCLLSKRKY